MVIDNIFRLPWWLLAALAVGAWMIADNAGIWASEREAAIVTALDRASAPIVAFDDLAVIDPAYTEAAFEAQIATAAVSEMGEVGDADRHTATLLPLVAADVVAEPESFRVFIVIEGVMRTNWERFIDPFVTGEGALGPIMSIEGEVLADGERRMAQKALGADRIADDAVWIKPYRSGRQTALQQGSDLAAWGALPFYGISLFFAAMAGARLYYGVRRSDD